MLNASCRRPPRLVLATQAGYSSYSFTIIWRVGQLCWSVWDPSGPAFSGFQGHSGFHSARGNRSLKMHGPLD
jgi:hypothetical protein